MTAHNLNTHSLTISSPVECGYGDYVVYHLDDQRAVGLEQEAFTRLFLDILRPTLHLEPTAHSAEEKHTLLMDRLQAFDPAIHATFIPRVLLELVLMRLCIDEDRKRKTICPLTTTRPLERERQDDDFIDELKMRTFCWHQFCFKDDGDETTHEFIHMAYLFNSILANYLTPVGSGFSFESLKTFTDREISYLIQVRKQWPQIESYERVNGDSGLTDSFSHAASFRGVDLYPLALTHPSHVGIIRNALILECCTVAQQAASILYRGSQRSADEWGSGDHSLSFGTGLFAGALFDPAATAFHYMRDESNDAFALFQFPVPAERSLVYTPTTYFLKQMVSFGEFFHPRTVVDKKSVETKYSLPSIPGITLGSLYRGEKRSLLKKFRNLLSDHPGKEIADQLKVTLRSAINLKIPLSFESRSEHPLPL